MKTTLPEQPTDKSSEGENSTHSQVIEFELLEWGDPAHLPEGAAAQNETKNDTSDDAKDQKSRRRWWVIVVVIALLLVAGGSTAAVLMLISDKSSDELNKNSSDFDFTDIPPGTDGPAPTASPPVASLTPSGSPTLTMLPSDLPSLMPSSLPSQAPSSSPTRVPSPPTIEPTMMSGDKPLFRALNNASETFGMFCAIADVPYVDADITALPVQINTQMEGCEFLVHLGDIMAGDTPCTIDRYMLAKDMLLNSSIPTFIVPGDNEVCTMFPPSTIHAFVTSLHFPFGM
jgi:hypothetical protein